MTEMRPEDRHARHARRVRILKVGLPLLALAIMSSLFLFSRSITMEGALPYAELDIEDRLREPKITDVNIATSNAEGAEIRISTQSITPTSTTQTSARQTIGVIVTPSGRRTEMTAPLIEYDTAAAKAALLGGVEVLSSRYRMTTEALDVAIERAQADSRSDVQATGPLGRLDAGKMHITQADDGFVIVFKSGVRLLYTP